MPIHFCCEYKKTIMNFKSSLVSNSVNIDLLNSECAITAYPQLKSLISRKTADSSLLFNVPTDKCVAHQESLLMSFLICTISKKKIPDLSMFSHLFQLIHGGELSQKMTVS